MYIFYIYFWFFYFWFYYFCFLFFLFGFDSSTSVAFHFHFLLFIASILILVICLVHSTLQKPNGNIWFISRMFVLDAVVHVQILLISLFLLFHCRLCVFLLLLSSWLCSLCCPIVKENTQTHTFLLCKHLFKLFNFFFSFFVVVFVSLLFVFFKPVKSSVQHSTAHLSHN